jgi:hypothetical protein
LPIIDNWLAFYPTHQLKIIFNEEIAQAPVESLKTIFCFLGVDEEAIKYTPDIGDKINAGKDMNIPTDCLRYLKQLYSPMIHELSKRYGSYANSWQEKYYS